MWYTALLYIVFYRLLYRLSQSFCAVYGLLRNAALIMGIRKF